MRYITNLLLLLCVMICVHGSAQQFLTGKIYKANSTEHLVSVSIHNITQQKYDLSEEDGSYHIQAAPGDHVSFSSVGFRTDTVTVTASLLTAAYPVYLDVRAQTLQTVRVGQLSNYQLDSMDRRKEYAWVYDHGTTPHVAKDRQGADGVGVTLNIFRKSGTQAQQRVKLEKRLEKEEEDYYVDSRYNKDYVSKITKLKGDSLSEFIRKFRPSYDYCRKAANVDILVYISDSYKQYMKGDN
jgi:hypothetical protein